MAWMRGGWALVAIPVPQTGFLWVGDRTCCFCTRCKEGTAATRAPTLYLSPGQDAQPCPRPYAKHDAVEKTYPCKEPCLGAGNPLLLSLSSCAACGGA